MAIFAIFRIRRDTAANWTAANPVLKLGEPGLETDTRKVKYGDGATAWNALGYSLADPADPDLIAIAALVSAADKLPYATGAGTWAMATFTAAGRALVDDADAAAQRTTLGLGTMATQGAGAVNITGGSATLASLLVSAATPLAEIRSSSTTSPFGLIFANGGTREAAITQQPNIAELVIDSGRSVGWGGKIRFVTDTVEKWRIESAGDFRPGADNTYNVGSASFRAATIFAGTGTINTSDARDKREVGEIPDAWLDAWADVKWSRFKFKDGERWHVGLVAQQVRDAFAAHGLDAREIGLLCYDEWPAQRALRAKHDRKGNLIRHAQPGRKAGNRWGLRYDECQALEAAWVRRELERLRER